MKKYLLISFASLLLVNSIAAQDTKPVVSNKAETTINGKPYSQHKAEQEALKRQRETNKAVLPADLGIVNAADAKPAPAKVQPAQHKGTEGKVLPSAPVVTEQAIVEAKQPAKEALVFNPTASVRTNAPVNNASTPVAGDAGLNIPSGAVNGSVLVTSDKPTEQIKPASRTAAQIEAATKQVVETKVQPGKNASATAVAPVPPSATVETSPSATNSTSGQAEKPAVVPAPKLKSEQAPDAPAPEVKAKQGN